MLTKLFLSVILIVGLFSLFYSNEEANAQQVPDIVFKITKASDESLDDDREL